VTPRRSHTFSRRRSHTPTLIHSTTHRSSLPHSHSLSLTNSRTHTCTGTHPQDALQRLMALVNNPGSREDPQAAATDNAIR
jgi:hypothetical protein